MSRGKNLEPRDFLAIWNLICQGITDDYQVMNEYRRLSGRTLSIESIRKCRKFLVYLINEVDNHPYFRDFIALYICRWRVIVTQGPKRGDE